MTEKLIWDVTVRAEGGPQLTGSGVLEVDAYDKLSVVVPAGGDLEVNLGPGAAGLIACLVILPDEPSADLSYDVGSQTIGLDEPQVLLGGAVDLTGNPASLTFANAGTADANLQILIGRDATP
ncbi:hypothetical protein [Blastococcus saxobsidens]|uniref:Uncharacterized protein n=1 Tax=Blastococcus saxobsidens (strain DD2) TaxID=1146883 RepID=H6RQ75_BLASD|nr:hypothetical protein [Blastococcus saxobsidens]CCG04042.1 protein of unknown function [Blastococcus saxobsidens DD2]